MRSDMIQQVEIDPHIMGTMDTVRDKTTWIILSSLSLPLSDAMHNSGIGKGARLNLLPVPNVNTRRSDEQQAQECNHISKSQSSITSSKAIEVFLMN